MQRHNCQYTALPVPDPVCHHALHTEYVLLLSYFQALGAALKSLAITVMRNAVLFIPAVILLNNLLGLNGVIAAQPIVETVLALVCIAMYTKDHAAKKAMTVKQS